MDKQLQDFDKAWKASPKDWPALRKMATAYAGSHPELATRYERLTRDDMVSVVSVARKRGDETERLEAEAWLLATYEPQKITGAAGPAPKGA